MRIAVHVTHEAMKKVGGIGAVLNGVCAAPTYKSFFGQTVLYGPLFGNKNDVHESFKDGGELLFSSIDGFDKDNYREVFKDIIENYCIDIVYGRRFLFDEFEKTKKTEANVFLVGISSMNREKVTKFKFKLWEKVGIQSDLYDHDWDYEQYLRIAIPFLEILDRLYKKDSEYYIFAHEYMGIPSALSIILKFGGKQKAYKTIFVAHEVSTARTLVERSPGHDISFYNILRAEKGKKSLEDVFGSQKSSSRNELIKCAVNFDRIFAVSDLIKAEYLFLVPDAPVEKIRATYNGLSVQNISFNQKKKSRNLIRRYAEKMLGFKPDIILTHVTRLVISKGLWRDIMLLYHLDEIFHSKNLKGVYILLSTFIATGRPSEDILRMEKEYGWPVNHRYGWPDLMGMEAEIHDYLKIFNQKSKSIKAVFLNQFGFDMKKCGLRVGEDTQFIDLRIASDAEFGFSIYEPFGIAQLETIPFGGAAILSSSCGSVSLLDEVFHRAKIKPYYALDFICNGSSLNCEELKTDLTIEKRTAIEERLFKKYANSIFEIIPTDDKARMKYLENASLYSCKLCWEHVVKNYFVPNLPT
ncbi:MAG: hypothetical protein PHW62_05800 [Candidatus Ratteibacteria bacterium]|nr:hypothetical protein [Candidatus Ratteibacteria bacterium]